MAFRASFCCGLLFLFCLVLVDAVKSRPVIGDDECAITEKYKCGEKPCNCRPVSPGLKGFILRYIFRQSPIEDKECDECDVHCERPSIVKCLNGVCRDSQCSCLPCWKGKSCDQPDVSSTPKFEQAHYAIAISPDAAIGSKLLSVAAFDKCSKHSKISYAITHGNKEQLFQMNPRSGSISVTKSLGSSVGKTIELTVIASKGEGADQSGVEAHVSVTVKKGGGRHRRSAHAHHIVRRDLASATVSPSLMLRISPEIVGNYTFYNKGDAISFRITCSHNVSAATKEPTISLPFECSSTFLTPVDTSFTMAAGSVTATGVTKTADDKLQYTATIGASAQLNASVTWNVKNDNNIYPLSNLYISCHMVKAGSPEYKIPPTLSSPMLYVVFPKVTLTRTTHLGQTVLALSSVPQYKLSIEMPTLNFPLLVELSTAINDVPFMAIQTATITTGSSITGASRQPTPTYHKSNNELTFNDRSNMDFGNLTVTGSSNNVIEITFSVPLRDHPLLSNGSKHWVGAGMRSGYQMLWVGQEALYVEKIQPALAIYFVTVNDTVASRYYKGDRLGLTFTLNHTATSTADAKDVVVTCYSKYVNFLSADYSNGGGSVQPFTLHNSTSLQSVTIASFSQGTTVTGSMSVDVNELVNPLVELDVTCELAYKNIASEDKMKTKHKPSPPYIAGVPVFVMNKTTGGPHRIGSKVCFTFSAMIRRMALPLTIEIIAPINGSSIFSIVEISNLKVGSNIENNAALQATSFVKRSTVNDTYFDRARAEFGYVKSFTGTESSPANEISFAFCVIINDHANITNGSKHWVGVGIKGGPRMMWIGEVSVVAVVPDYRKPVLKVDISCTVPGTQQKCADTLLNKGSLVQYNVTVAHDPDSQRHAHNIKSLVMIPPYVRFEQQEATSDRLAYTLTKGGPSYIDNQPFRFLDTLFMSFKAKLDPNGMMPPGVQLAASIMSVTYTGENPADVFNYPLTSVTAKFNNPDLLTPPTQPPIVPEYYNQGIYLDKINNILYVCKHNEDSLKSSCFYTTQCGSGIWMRIDSQVACIIGKKSNGILYGVSKNKRAYVEQSTHDQPWMAIRAADWNAAKASASPSNKFEITSLITDTGDTPSNELAGAGGKQFAANKKGVFCRDSSSAMWAMKAKWGCCS